jgi:predicted phosphate transport protein (TIGR00153 family)
MPFYKFIPHEVKFFDLFDKQADIMVNAVTCFENFAENGNFDDECIEKLRQIEHEADTIAHDIIDSLNRTFITPFDREDIHSLANELDDVVDLIYAISKRMRLYKLKGKNRDIIEFAHLIMRSVQSLSLAVKGLRNHRQPQQIKEACIEINKIENISDQLRDTVIQKLLESKKNPITIIKYKEIYELLETVLDVCEDISNIVVSILVKQG